MSNRELEDLCAHVLREQDAAGVLLLVITKQQRAEVVGAFTEAVDDLPGRLHRLADEVASGGGIPIGRHQQTISE